MTPGIVAESDLSGVTKSEYVFFAGERVARRDGVNGAGGIFYYFSDHLKTASVITDSAGNIKAESDYYPWGGELQYVNADSNHYKFTGKERDSDTQLDYFGARYYSYGFGRFTSADPKMISKQRKLDPRQWNMYTYTANNPLKYVDPDGKELTIATGMSKADTERVTNALVEVYRKPGGAARIENLAKSDVKFVVGTGPLSGAGYGLTTMKGTIDPGTKKADRSDTTVTITLDFAQSDKDKVDHDLGLRKNAPPPDDQVTGHEIVHADIADKDLDAQRGKTDAEKEADAAPGTDELNAEKKGDKKSAKKRVNEILHPTQEQQ